jgi:hypothetical protein
MIFKDSKIFPKKINKLLARKTFVITSLSLGSLGKTVYKIILA